MTIRSTTLETLFAFGLFVLSACGPSSDGRTTATGREGWPKELTIGFAGGNDMESAIERNRPVAELIEKATGIPVKLYTATSYSAVVQAMRSGRVDGLQTGVFSYLLAVNEARAEALAVNIYSFAKDPVYDPSLMPEYYSIIAVKKGNGINSLADIRGRTFTFVEPASTSGHLVPKTELIKAGLIPDTDFRTRFAGGHQASIIALRNGTSDASAVAEPALRDMLNGGQIEFCSFPENEIGRLRTPAEVRKVFDACPDGMLAPLHYSFPVPGTPIAFRSDLPADLKAAIKEALLSTPNDPAFIKAAHRWYVDPTDARGLPTLDSYYNPLREMAKLLDLDLRELQ